MASDCHFMSVCPGWLCTKSPGVEFQGTIFALQPQAFLSSEDRITPSLMIHCVPSAVSGKSHRLLMLESCQLSVAHPVSHKVSVCAVGKRLRKGAVIAVGCAWVNSI